MHIGAVGDLRGRARLPRRRRHRLRRASGASWRAASIGIPRYRQRLEHGFRSSVIPVWVDDARFNLDYHLRHTALAAPRRRAAAEAPRRAPDVAAARPRQTAVGDVVVEGLEGNRFARRHEGAPLHGRRIGGVELTGSVMRPTSGPTTARRRARRRAGIRGRRPRRADCWPRGRPPRAQSRSAAAPGSRRARAIRCRRSRVPPAGAVAGTVGAALAASATPLNVEIGPHRRFDWTAMDLAA